VNFQTVFTTKNGLLICTNRKLNELLPKKWIELPFGPNPTAINNQENRSMLHSGIWAGPFSCTEPV
jgi:hypothetical protein